MDAVKMYCPKCSWEPKETDLWKCSCGYKWNIFSTGGRCLSFGYVWKITQCHRPSRGGCHPFSPHLDWYHGLDGSMNQLKEEITADWEKQPELERLPK